MSDSVGAAIFLGAGGLLTLGTLALTWKEAGFRRRAIFQIDDEGRTRAIGIAKKGLGANPKPWSLPIRIRTQGDQ